MARPDSIKFHYLNFMRLVQMRAGQKKDTTSLEMAVSVVMAPHQSFVRRACSKSCVEVRQGFNRDLILVISPQEGNIVLRFFLTCSLESDCVHRSIRQEVNL